MPVPFRYLLAILLTLGGTLSAAPKFTTVVLDPGHGGKDDGASWSGLDEKDLNLDVCKRVENVLRKKGVPTVMTRRSDIYRSLDERAAIANKYKSSIFVSVHFNAHRDRSIHGMETYYYSPDGAKLATTLQKALAGRMATKNRGVKKAPFKVLLLTKSTAVLMECAFMSNRVENAKMRSAAYRQKLAEAIASGILTARGR